MSEVIHNSEEKALDERALMTESVIEGLIHMRLRENEYPRNVDALRAARDFYESRIIRDYVPRVQARAEVEALLNIVDDLWRHMADASGDEKRYLHTEELEKRVLDVTANARKAFIKTSTKSK